jgi:hypothetical protein
MLFITAAAAFVKYSDFVGRITNKEISLFSTESAALFIKGFHMPSKMAADPLTMLILVRSAAALVACIIWWRPQLL